MNDSLYNYTLEQLNQWMVDHQQKSYRSKQLFSWLYRKRVSDPLLMSDLSKELSTTLATTFNQDLLTLVLKQVSIDQTTKYLFALQDGSLVETVLMHMDYGKSVCVSSQIGCNMGCTFCASGLIKKSRNVTAGEMVAQILYVQKELDQTQERVSHVVVMGIGEPFDNYDHVINFLKIINDDLGLAIGARHLTVSTCGIPDKIVAFAKEPIQANLAISLHAPNDELRSSLMPINQAYPLAVLMDAIKQYQQYSNRKITFEYILLKGVNDQAEHAKELAALMKGHHGYVNLIPYNPVKERDYQKVSKSEALRFYDQCRKLGVQATLRVEHGADIDAACGQLRSSEERRKAI